MSGERLTARISGHVQGVGFRWWVRRHADELGLTGWVMNSDDERSVELVAEGPVEGIAALERLIQRGPPGARVDAVDGRRTAPSGEFDGFGIVRP